MLDNNIVLLAAGDCGPVHGPSQGFLLSRYSEAIKPIFSKADVRLGNCERQYSNHIPANALTVHGCQPPEMAQIFSDLNFDVLNLANNHMYDAGEQALLDTRELMIQKGIAVTGAGKNLEEARRPAILEKKGIKIGFISFCSALSKDSEAGPNKAGVAPLRVDTQYETRGPHVAVRIRTQPNESDLNEILNDIHLIRKQVDIVIVSFHWGVIWVPRVIADYQVIAAHACIDAGADLIIGHHPHIPKAIEVYKGKTIFYSLCHLCMTKPEPSAPWKELPWEHGALRNYQDLDQDYPFLPYGSHATKTLLAKAVLNKKGILDVSFIPMVIDNQYRPVPLSNDDPRFSEMVRYMNWTSEGFNHHFEVNGNEVRIT